MSMTEFERLIQATLEPYAQQGAAFYSQLDHRYRFVLSFLEQQHVAFEGPPGVGKTTLVHSVTAALRANGAKVRKHEENRMTDTLQQFFRDPPNNAFWFQMLKLADRQLTCGAIDAESRSGSTIHVMDRTLPGDMAFALYHFIKGNMSKEQFRIYMEQLTKIQYRPPLLIIYPYATPENLVKRVAVRGDAEEIRHYTVDYFKDMDACYRAALDMSGAAYCIIDWNEDIPGVGVPSTVAEKPLIPADRCMALLEQAISLTYGDDIRRINRHRAALSSQYTQLVPGTGQSLFGCDPTTAVEASHAQWFKRSAEIRRGDSDGSETASTDCDASAGNSEGDNEWEERLLPKTSVWA